MAVARERAIFDAVGDEFVDRERQRLRRFVVELDLGTGDGGEPLGRYARQFEFAADDAAELDAADRPADRPLIRVGTRGHTAAVTGLGMPQSRSDQQSTCTDRADALDSASYA